MAPRKPKTQEAEIESLLAEMTNEDNAATETEQARRDALDCGCACDNCQCESNDCDDCGCIALGGAIEEPEDVIIASHISLDGSTRLDVRVSGGSHYVDAYYPGDIVLEIELNNERNRSSVARQVASVLARHTQSVKIITDSETEGE